MKSVLWIVSSVLAGGVTVVVAFSVLGGGGGLDANTLPSSIPSVGVRVVTTLEQRAEQRGT